MCCIADAVDYPNQAPVTKQWDFTRNELVDAAERNLTLAERQWGHVGDYFSLEEGSVPYVLNLAAFLAKTGLFHGHKPFCQLLL